MIALRLKRRIANLATIASLLICLGAIGLWILTTFGWGHYTALQGPHTSYIAGISGGYLTLQIAGVRPDPERPATAGWQWFGGSHFFNPTGSLDDKSMFSRVGLISTLERIPYSDGMLEKDTNEWMNAVCRSFVIPLVLIALLAALLPFRWARERVHEHFRQLRIRQGRCGDCGYDLRGSAERCPECGAISDTASAAVGPNKSTQ
jgi:hypothetical protein